MSQTTYTAPNDGYDWDGDGQIKRGSTGTYILRSDCDAVVKKPSWFRTETVIRPYPALADGTNPNSSQFEPYRVIDATGRNRFSNWIRKYICAWGVGNPATTYLIRRQSGSSAVFDPATTPLGMLYRAINNAVKRGQAHPEWPPLIMAHSGKSAMLTGPKECYLIQGALFRHDKKDYFGRFGEPLGWGKNQPLILLISSGAGSDLCNLLNTEREGYHGEPMDFEARYAQGDPVGLDAGRFLHFCEKGTNINRYQSQPQGNPIGDDGWGSSGSKKTKDIGFDIFFSQEFEGNKAKIGKIGEKEVRQKWRAWDRILYFPTEIEQAHMLFKCFPLSACMYAFEGVNKDWIPEDAYRRHVAATSVQTGYNPGAYGGPPGAVGYGHAQPGYTQQNPAYPPQPQVTPQNVGWGPSQGVSFPPEDQSVPKHDSSADAVDAGFGYKTPPVPVNETVEKTIEKPVENPNTAEAIATLAKARRSLKS